jgi:ParB/RepB/Spo0J family partition protein
MQTYMLRSVSALKCMLCGRQAGRVLDGHFERDSSTKAPVLTSAAEHCGECGGSLYIEASERAVEREVVGMTHATNGMQSQIRAVDSEPLKLKRADRPEIQVILAPINTVLETPKERNSRVRYDGPALDELAASIQEHGVLQPILVRPAVERDISDTLFSAEDGHGAAYIVVAGNRRLQAARKAGLTSVPCIIRVTDADNAFLLNVVENLQRRELSGRERVRALVLLADLADASGHPLGVREISRRTGLATGTISTWLRIHRRPPLLAALEQDQLDIGRAMALASAPDDCLTDLITRARSLSQAQIKAEVASARQAAKRPGLDIATDERYARVAYEALQRVHGTQGRVREVLAEVQRELNRLLTQ